MAGNQALDLVSSETLIINSRQLKARNLGDDGLSPDHAVFYLGILPSAKQHCEDYSAKNTLWLIVGGFLVLQPHLLQGELL
jgi:hypothetical protein